MQGLSSPAQQIIKSLSELDFLKDYQSVGGTALALQIHHRLSDDLDFCNWVPDTSNVKYSVDPQLWESSLAAKFGEVEKNHLGFSQVNFLIKNPEVKVTCYHTGLAKPKEPPVHIIGNIYASDVEVLGGSKLFLITQRTQIRDFYDIYVLLNTNKMSLEQMFLMALSMDRQVTPKKIHAILTQARFNDKNVERELAHLEPAFPITAQELNKFFDEVKLTIEKTYNIQKNIGHRP